MITWGPAEESVHNVELEEIKRLYLGLIQMLNEIAREYSISWSGNDSLLFSNDFTY